MNELDQLIKDSLLKLRDAIAKNIQSTGSNASGKTIQSMVVEGGNGVFSLLGRAFFGSLETGRKRGKATPVSVILDWLMAKGLAKGDGRENLSFAFAISRTHAKVGSSLHRKGGRTDIYTEEIEKFKQKLYKDFASKLELIVINYVGRNNK